MSNELDLIIDYNYLACLFKDVIKDVAFLFGHIYRLYHTIILGKQIHFALVIRCLFRYGPNVFAG